MLQCWLSAAAAAHRLPTPCRPNLQALLRGSMRKAFGGMDLWMLGLGLVVATGWATLSGSAAQQYAG